MSWYHHEYKHKVQYCSKKKKKVNKNKTKHKSQLKEKMNDENLETKAGLSVQMSCNTSNLGKNVNNVRFD